MTDQQTKEVKELLEEASSNAEEGLNACIDAKGNADQALALLKQPPPTAQAGELEPNGTAKDEFMHESLEKDAVKYDLPTEEIIVALADDNKNLKDRLDQSEAEKKECHQILEKQLDRDKDPQDSLRDLVVVACNALYWARAKKEHFVMAELKRKIDQLEGENKRFLAYIKDLHARGICSTMSISEKCNIPYDVVSSWYEEKTNGR